MEAYLYRNTFWITIVRKTLPDGTVVVVWGVTNIDFLPLTYMTFEEAYLAELYLDKLYEGAFNDKTGRTGSL